MLDPAYAHVGEFLFGGDFVFEDDPAPTKYRTSEGDFEMYAVHEGRVAVICDPATIDGRRFTVHANVRCQGVGRAGDVGRAAGEELAAHHGWFVRPVDIDISEGNAGGHRLMPVHLTPRPWPPAAISAGAAAKLAWSLVTAVGAWAYTPQGQHALLDAAERIANVDIATATKALAAAQAALAVAESNLTAARMQLDGIVSRRVLAAAGRP